MWGVHRTVFVWWCLLQLQTSVLRTVYADDTSRTVVNYGEMGQSVVNTESVLADGNEVYLGEWLSDVGGEYSAKGEYFKMTVMYKFVKCECAHFVRTFIASVYRFWASPDSGLEKRTAIPYLISLNSDIKTAMTELFAISDEFTNLKTGEPYFVKTLLMTSFYVDTFLVPFERNESRGVDETPTLLDMDRVLLQIINLIRHYAIENCNPGRLDDDHDHNGGGGGGGRGNVNEQLLLLQHGFRGFLEKIAYTVVSDDRGRMQRRPWYSTVDLGGIKYEKCMNRGHAVGETFDLCDFLRNSVITRPDGMQIYIPELFGEVEGSSHNAVVAVYEYLFVVFRVLVKYAYRLTAAFWQDDTARLDVDRCERTIVKLRSMHCPVELVDHLESVLQVERYRNEEKIFDRLRTTALRIVKTRSDRIDDVTLPVTETGLSLLDLMDAVMVDELRQFWWAFILLHEDQQRKSQEVYENVSLSLFAETTRVENQSECEALKQIHPQCLSVERTIDECLRLQSGAASTGAAEYVSRIANCLSEIRDPGLIGLSNQLLIKLDEWTDGVETVEHLRIDMDIMNIFMCAAIGLRKELNIDGYTAAASDLNLHTASRILIVGKLQKWKRLVNEIMNVLDNYHIRKCPVIEDRIKRSKKGEIDQQVLSHNYNNDNNCSRRKTSAAYFCTIYESTTINRNFYSITHLTGEYNVERSNCLGSEIFFDWHGEVKSMREIRTDVLENMLDIHDLVLYQRLHLNWMLYLYYRTWFMAFDDKIILNQDKNLQEPIYSTAFASLEEFNKIIHPMTFGTYGDYCETKTDLYKVIYEVDKDKRGSALTEGVEKEIISLVGRRLGVVREGDIINTTDFQNFFNIHDTDWHHLPVFSSLLWTALNRLTEIDETFQFVPTVEYTRNNLQIDEMDVSDEEE